MCRRCVCARNGRPCHSCLPLSSQRCLNVTAANTQRLTRAAVTASNPAPSRERSLSPDGSLSVSLSVSESPVAPQSGLDTSHSPHSENLSNGTEGHYLEDEVRELMIKAYGRELMTTADTPPGLVAGRSLLNTKLVTTHYLVVLSVENMWIR